MDDSSEIIKKYYNTFWSTFLQKWQIKNVFKQRANNHDTAVSLNDVIWENLGLDPVKNTQVLDAGCGIGRTTIYLAKKYPKVQFHGISLASEEIRIANELRAQNNIVENTHFFEGNYCCTPFPDDYFDGIFILESMNYAKNKIHAIHEFYRILKPGSKLIIIGGFRKEKQLNPILFKFYSIWLRGRALTDLEKIGNIITYLHQEKFSDIQQKDIALSLTRSYIVECIMAIPFLYGTLLKKILFFRSYKPETDPMFFISVAPLENLFGIVDFTSYYLISAVKPI